MVDQLVEDAKARLREEVHLRRAALGSSERAEASKAAAEHFLGAMEFTPDQMVSAFWPIRDEIDCKPILISLMDSFQPVCLPVVMGSEQPLVFRQWELGEPLYEAGFGTLVPHDDAPVVLPDVVVMPLLAFDASGARLGYGKGYYDRTIAAMEKKPLLIGYAFAAQEIEQVPTGPHDVPLDYVVTEDGMRKFS